MGQNKQQQKFCIIVCEHVISLKEIFNKNKLRLYDKKKI